MKLSELLDELRVGILNDRSSRIAGSADDYLWTDTRLVRYINEAHRRFAKRSLVLRDSRTSEVVNVTVKAGVVDYDLHPAIIAVTSAQLNGATTDLVRIGHTVLHSYMTASNVIEPASYEQIPPGPPMAFATDETLVYDDDDTLATISMRLYPTPRTEDDGTIIKLRTIRMPLDDLTTNNLSAVPEVPRDHHLEMLDWAASLALRIVDDDAGSISRSKDFAASFEAHVIAARELILNKMFVPQRWGFGRGGWSWRS